jgi:hypothetical protein
MFRHLCFLSTLFSAGLFAQTWEVGALGGFGFSNDLTVKSPAGSANASLAKGAVIGVFGGDDTYNYFSGEARYLYRYSDLRLSSGGTSVDFAGHTHIAEGVFLFHFRPRQSRIRPFIAAGGGVSVVVGTGTESAAQPLGKFAALTATRQTLPTADVGLGVKINLPHHLRLRLEADDYISSTPNQVIAPAPGATVKGWLNNVIAFGALSYTF